MKEFSAYMAPVMTFYSRPFYKDLALNGKGLGFLYLFLLLLICWTPVCTKLYYSMESGCHNQEAVAFINQIPEMTWTGSKLSIDKSCPYFVSVDGKPLIAYDTTGKMKALSDANPAQILLTEENFVARKEQGTEETVPYKQFVTDFKVGPTAIKDFLSKLPLWLSVAAWCCGVFVWVGHLIVALLLGAIGLLMDKRKLGYGTAVRLAAFAMTPAIILSTVIALTKLTIPGWNLLSLVVSAGFLYLAYSSVNQEA
jgi:hypothetical protein